MYIHRELEYKIRSCLDMPEIIAILGARQVGKTTLLQNMFQNNPKCKMITFENHDLLSLFQEDIDSFVRLYVAPYEVIIIDEFQYAFEGGRNLKFIYDTQPGKKIIISGSSSLELTHQATKFLVGRIFQFQLFPLSFYEFLSFNDKIGYENLLTKLMFDVQKSINLLDHELPLLTPAVANRFSRHVDDFIIYGGFPRVATSANIDEKKLVLDNIIETYLLKEIRDILHRSDDIEIKKLSRYLSLRIAQYLQYNDISQALGIYHNKVLEFINILEKTYLVDLIEPFYSNKLLEITKSKKVFFADTGFRNALIQNFQDLALRTDKGALCESFVFAELQKFGIGLKYWRTKSKAEVDLILEVNNKPIPIEVKSKLVKPSMTKSLISFINKYSPPIAIIFSKDFLHIKKYNDTNIYFLPFFLVGSIKNISIP